MIMENLRVCSRCIMDSTAPFITFDDKGICNYCHEHDEMEKKFPLGQTGEQNLSKLVENIKKDGKHKEYDCVLGVSGGTDSTYVLYLAKKLGLRPLAVHLDNGWNTEVSSNNIKNAIQKLNVDLYTYVIDWEEFKDLQLSFLKASVPGIEVTTDNAIKAVLYKAAAKRGIGHIVHGENFRSEGATPLGWTYVDGKYIKSVHRKYRKMKLRSYPNFTLYDKFYFMMVKRIKVARLLNYIDYNKNEAKEILRQNLDWQDYGGHHHESVITRFLQSYILPRKFNIDKRKIGYSAMVRSGHMSRDEALRIIREEDICSEHLIATDLKYVLNKYNLTEEEFKNIMAQPPKSFLDYSTNYRLRPLIKFLSRIIPH